jgi:hypothetical protein
MSCNHCALTLTPLLQFSDAVEPFKRMSENFRSRLRDQWNLRALTHTETEGTGLEHGCPREQGKSLVVGVEAFVMGV